MNRSRLIVVGGVIAAFLLLASRGLTSGYSYWADELFSLATSQAGWKRMFTRWVLPDTHPPLYPVLLKVWMSMLGPSEAATRSLSFLAAGCSLVLAAVLTRGRTLIHQLVVVAFIGSSSAFAYYGQETRNYALVLLLSTILTGVTLLLRNHGGAEGSLVRRRRLLLVAFYLSAVLLSLTHYFAWLFVLVLVVFTLIEGRVDQHRSRGYLLLFAISLWPIFHFLASRGSGKRGKIDWIDVDPVVGTLEAMLRGVFDVLLSPAFNLVAGVLAVILLLSLLVFAWRRRMARAGGPSQDDLGLRALGDGRFLLLILALFIAVVGCIDLILPISTPRNFIVLLPAVAFLAGAGAEIGFSGGWRLRFLVLVLLSLMFSSQLRMAHIRLAEKHGPATNFKDLAAFLVQERACEQGCLYLGSPRKPVLDIYFSRLRLSRIRSIDSRPSWSQGVPLILSSLRGDVPPDQVIQKLPGYACWQPVQSRRNTVMVFLSKAQFGGFSGNRLRRCPS